MDPKCRCPQSSFIPAHNMCHHINPGPFCSICDVMVTPQLTLPVDSKERKDLPVFSGCLAYFPAALVAVSKVSKQGNDKHNPGQPLHHARGKSSDHVDCIIRHLLDTADLITAKERDPDMLHDSKYNEQILQEVSQAAWRVLAYSQELHERLGQAPLAPAAKLEYK